MDSNKQALKAGIAYTISSFLISGMSFLTTPIFTRILSQNDFGNYNNFISWLNILTIIVTLKASASFISARYEYEKDFNKYVYSIMVLTTIITLVVMIIVNVSRTFFVSFFGMNLIYINIMFLYICFYEFINIYQIREQFYFRYNNYIGLGLVVSITTAICSVILIYVIDDKLKGRILGYTIPAIVIGMVVFISFAFKYRSINLKYWKYALPLAIPFIPHLLSLTLLNSVDRIMITEICGTKDTALYSLAYTCSSIVTVLMSAMNNAYSPWLAEQLNKNQFEKIRKFSYVYIFTFFFLVFGIILIAPEILLVLGGKKYLEAVYVMPPVMLGCSFQLLYTMHVNVEQFKKKNVGMAIASVIAALSNYVLNMIFIPYCGYIAAAYTTLISYFILLILHMILVKRLKIGRIYNNKYIFASIVVGVIWGMVSIVLYSKNTIRYMFVMLYVILFMMALWRYRNRIICFMNKHEQC